MATTTRWTSDTKFRGPGQTALLSLELTRAAGEQCYASLEQGVGTGEQDGQDRITITSTNPILDATIDATLAAFPTTVIAAFDVLVDNVLVEITPNNWATIYTWAIPDGTCVGIDGKMFVRASSSRGQIRAGLIRLDGAAGRLGAANATLVGSAPIVLSNISRFEVKFDVNGNDLELQARANTTDTFEITVQADVSEF